MRRKGHAPHPDQFEFEFHAPIKPVAKPANDNMEFWHQIDQYHASAETNWNALPSSLRQVLAIAEMPCCLENAWAISDALSIVNDLIEDINCDLRAAKDSDC